VDAIAVDKNTNLEQATIDEWSSTFVIGPGGKQFNKHKLVKAMNSPGTELLDVCANCHILSFFPIPFYYLSTIAALLLFEGLPVSSSAPWRVPVLCK